MRIPAVGLRTTQTAGLRGTGPRPSASWVLMEEWPPSIRSEGISNVAIEKDTIFVPSWRGPNLVASFCGWPRFVDSRISRDERGSGMSEQKMLDIIEEMSIVSTTREFKWNPCEGRKMTREEAMELVKSKVKNRNLVKHMIATESCMRALAWQFGEDADLWGLAGLLHDLDYDQTANDSSKHGLLGAQMLEERGVDDQIVHAVKAHAGHVETESRMDKALFAVDPLTGLIVAAALMHPTKKISNVDARFVLNRFEEKRFAAGVNRDAIKGCENLGLSLEEFIAISLRAMENVADELGL